MRNALVVVALMFLVFLILIGCGQKLANSPSKLNSGEGLQSEKQTSIREGRGPAPVYLEFSVVPEHQDYDQGDSVHFSISIKNVWDDSLDIANIPSILIGPFAIPTDKYERVSITSIGKKTLKPQESITASAVWHQNGEPGLYQVEFGDIDLGHTRLSGGGSRFFVKYSSEKILTKTIEPGAIIKLPEEDGDLSFVVKRIEMNEHETVVFFDFNTEQEAPMGFQMALVRSNGEAHLKPEPDHGGEQSEQKNGVIHGLAKFNPTTTDITQLQIVITDWSVIHKGVSTEIIKGPWTVDIPLK
ncbi:hypothetical protein [Paenibacillus humicola]|uniref:hypothetical protein n=1 Tax=Paenibacillus humicola TaxID=3110540 RepID=UPI00237BB8CF|nr:hypothetical protein [Paenibacillus humicola]